MQEVVAILRVARSRGVDTVDTAVTYGESESRLGEVGIAGMRVFSKLPGLPAGCPDLAGWVADTVGSSLGLLRVSALDGLLLHRPMELVSGHGRQLYDVLLELKALGVIRAVGYSVYDPSELTRLVEDFPPDVVQLPFSVLDRRFSTSGWINRLRDTGTEVHTRSLFLQGLLLMPPERRPRAFGKWQALWDKWDRWLREEGLSALEATVRFATAQSGIDRVIVGVDNVAQLQEILDVADAEPIDVPDWLQSTDRELIDPSSWNTQ